MNTSRAGNKYERRVVNLLEAHGYKTKISRMSKSGFDRFAERPGEPMRAIQVKGVGRASVARGASYLGTKAYRLELAVEALPEPVTREFWRVEAHPAGRPKRGYVLPEGEGREAYRILPNGDLVPIPLIPGMALWKPRGKRSLAAKARSKAG